MIKLFREKAYNTTITRESNQQGYLVTIFFKAYSLRFRVSDLNDIPKKLKGFKTQ